MRKKNAFITAFAAAFAGALVTTYITTRAANAPAPTPIALTPSEIVTVEHDGAVAQRTAPGVWTITLPSDDTAWPGSTAAVRAALRAAADITAIEAAGAAGSEPPRVYRFTNADGDSRTLAIADAAIGGKQSVVIDSASTVRAPAELVARLEPGPAAWRDHSVFPGAGAEITRLLIQQPATETDPALEIDLIKTAGRWLIASPVLARASDDAVRTAIARVAGASIVRFLDGAPDDLTTGLDSPAFVIITEAGERVRRLNFGAQADAAGAQRFATTGAGHYFVADTSLLRELRLDPAAYTDRRVSVVSPADVHALRLNDTRATRTLSGWTDAPFDPAAILLALTARADATVTFEAPDGWSERAAIALEDLAGDPLDVITIGEDAAGALHAETSIPGGGPVYYALPATLRQSLALE